MLAKSGRKSPSKSAIANCGPGPTEVTGPFWISAAPAVLRPARPKSTDKEINRNRSRNARQLSLAPILRTNFRLMSTTTHSQTPVMPLSITFSRGPRKRGYFRSVSFFKGRFHLVSTPHILARLAFNKANATTDCELPTNSGTRGRIVRLSAAQKASPRNLNTSEH